MKWDKPTGCTQHTSDGRYCIMAANSKDWVAYLLGYTCANDLGTRNSDEDARQLCEANEARRSA